MAGRVKTAAKKNAAKEKKAADKKPDKKVTVKDSKVKENKAVKPEKKAVTKKSNTMPVSGKIKDAAIRAMRPSREKKTAEQNTVHEARLPIPESVPTPATLGNQEKLPREKTSGFFNKLFRALSGGGGEPFPGPKGEKAWTNSLGMEFVFCPTGTFMMGSKLDRFYSLPDKRNKTFEKYLYQYNWELDKEQNKGKKFLAFNITSPVHKVTITKPYYMAKFPTTLAEWQAIMGNNPFTETGNNIGLAYHPSRLVKKIPWFDANTLVEKISWFDAQCFIKKLNKAEKTTRYRLPTEAEWEYAARAGSTTEFFWGDSIEPLKNYVHSSRWGRPHDQLTATQQPNPWGLYDLYRSVGQWVQDWYDNYTSTSKIDPYGPQEMPQSPIGPLRVFRGTGMYMPDEMLCVNGVPTVGSALRFRASPDSNFYGYGFRLALTIEG